MKRERPKPTPMREFPNKGFTVTEKAIMWSAIIIGLAYFVFTVYAVFSQGTCFCQ